MNPRTPMGVIRFVTADAIFDSLDQDEDII